MQVQYCSIGTLFDQIENGSMVTKALLVVFIVILKECSFIEIRSTVLKCGSSQCYACLTHDKPWPRQKLLAIITNRQQRVGKHAAAEEILHASKKISPAIFRDVSKQLEALRSSQQATYR